MKRFGFAAALTAFFAAPAIAADLGVPTYRAPPPLPPRPVYTWTGCWVGAGGGYSLWDQGYGTDSNWSDGSTVTDLNAGGKGWFGTAGVGCDYQFARSWLIGAFGDFDFSSISGTPHFTSFGTDVHGKEKEDWAWAAGARLGYLITPTVLGYVSAGWTEKHFKSFGLFETFTGASFGDSIGSHTYGGWFLGSGYEYSLASLGLPQLTWKTEYRYASTNTWNTCTIDTSGHNDDCFIHFKKYQQSIRSELVWRFNWGGWGKGKSVPLQASY